MYKSEQPKNTTEDTFSPEKELKTAHDNMKALQTRTHRLEAEVSSLKENLKRMTNKLNHLSAELNKVTHLLSR